MKNSFNDLINFYLDSIIMLLRATRLPQASLLLLRENLAQGDYQVLAGLFGGEGIGNTRADQSDPTLAELVVRFAKAINSLRKDTVESSTLNEAAKISLALGKLCETLGENTTAYNFYEITYHFLGILDLPALAAAEKLRALSNPDKIDQYHGAVWHLAAERIRHCCEQRCDWLSALDAYELALSCPAENPWFQRHLCEALERQLQKAQGSPIQELIVIYFVQAPITGVSAEKRKRVIETFCEREMPDNGPESLAHAMETWAMAKSQSIFDDMRQRFQPVERIDHPYIEWSDVAVRHDRLSGAVPLGRSLIADIERTKRLLPDLVHEICHAVALLGHIGIHQSAFRAGVHYLELMCINLAGGEPDPKALRALPSLPAHPYASVLASLQLRSATKAAVAKAVWTPWLEGLSMYFELLCDPKDHETEISAVHDCLRLLIDFGVERRKNETPADYAQRQAEEATRQFEAFFSRALKDTARSATIGYFTDYQPGISDVYVLGYLLVRSVVAAWEATLGRRLVPMQAAIMLLNATQAGVADGLPPLDLSPREFPAACQSAMIAWMTNLSGLSKNLLEEWLRPVAIDCPGRAWLWQDGKPREVTPEELLTALSERSERREERELLRLVGIDPDTTDEHVEVHSRLLSELFHSYVVRNKLLPIGRDTPRMLLMQASEQAGVCTRTYVGKRQPEGQETAAGMPRYSVWFWPLDQSDAKEHLRRSFGREGTARVTASRIIDLVGFPEAPFPGRMSYTSFFLGSRFSYVSLSGNPTDRSKSYPEFTAMLNQRLLGTTLFEEEGSTLGSLKFLTERLRRAGSLPDDFQEIASLNVKDFALETLMLAAATAFANGAVPAFTEGYRSAMSVLGVRQAIGRTLNHSGLGENREKELALATSALARLIFSDASPSGVRPFQR